MALSSQPPRPASSRPRPNYPRVLGLGAIALIAVACGGTVDQENAGGSGKGGWGQAGGGAGASSWPEDAQIPPATGGYSNGGSSGWGTPGGVADAGPWDAPAANGGSSGVGGAAGGAGGSSGYGQAGGGAGASSWPEDAQVPPEEDADAETPIDAAEPDACDDGGCDAGDPNSAGGIAESFNDGGAD